MAHHFSLFAFFAVFCLVSGNMNSAVTSSGSNSPSQLPKLTYFNGRGVAEVSRILMRIGSMDFEDHRIPITRVNSTYDTDGEFTKSRDAGKFARNLDRIPIFETGKGVKIGQSKAIERYIAQKCGLMGESLEERAVIDCIVENTQDIKERWTKLRQFQGDSQEKKQLIEKWFRGGELADWLSKLENSLPESFDERFAVGSHLSYADVCIWQVLRDFFDDKDAVAWIEEQNICPKLSTISNNVAQNEELKMWLAIRPKTAF